MIIFSAYAFCVAKATGLPRRAFELRTDECWSVNMTTRGFNSHKSNDFSMASKPFKWTTFGDLEARIKHEARFLLTYILDQPPLPTPDISQRELPAFATKDSIRRELLYCVMLGMPLRCYVAIKYRH